MNIRQLAEQDLSVTLEDAETGFGWPVILTDPDGVSVNITAQSNDVSQIIDPDTGVAVSGRQCAAVMRLSSLYALGVGIPKGVPEPDRTPWLVQFPDINGIPYTFKVEYSDPDRTLGTVTLILGVWDD